MHAASDRAALAAAFAAALALAGPPAHAITLVIGGQAGQCYQEARAGRFNAAARDICTQALDAGGGLTNHDLAGTHINRGAMEMQAKDFEAAHADFQEAIKIAPRMGEGYIGEGAYLVLMERYKDAEPLLDRGIELGVEEPEKAYYYRGMARWGQDNFKGAYLDFKKASELKPNWDLPKERLTHFQVEPAK
jgi:tetratricopeptide (TPR) repeat protein